MDPVLKSALNMGVSITEIVITLQTVSKNAQSLIRHLGILLDNVKYDAAAKIYATKVMLRRRLTI